jgi:hypothetical protein
MSTSNTFDQNYTKTKFSEIFKKTYWGKKSNSSEKIIENRNNFVVNNYIQEATSIDEKTKDIFDAFGESHNQECYINTDNLCILISSSYHISKERTNERVDNLTANGWILTDKLYNDSAMTFIKITDIYKT